MWNTLSCHARVLEGVAKSQSPLKAQVFKSQPSSSSLLISSLSHAHATLNLEWCDKMKLSNLRLPRKSGTFKSLQLLSTSRTLLATKVNRRSNERPQTFHHFLEPGVATAFGATTLESLSLRLKDLLGPVTRVKQKKKTSSRRTMGRGAISLVRSKSSF